MSRELDLQALRLVVALEQTLSLRAAGQQLGVSQPAASQCLRAFETRWRLRIAHRDPRGTTLTPAGLTVAAWAADLLHRVDTLRGGLVALSEQHDDDPQDFGVAASLTIAEFLLPRWLADLRRQRPEVHPRLDVVNSDAVSALVRSGACRLGFVETAAVAEDLARSVIGADRLVIVVDPTHQWARRSTPLTRDQLLEAEYVVREEGSGTRSTFERSLAGLPRIAMVATSTAATVGAAVAGVGPAVVSRHGALGALERGELVEVIHNLDLERPLTAVWHPGRQLSPQAALLIAIAKRGVASAAPN